MWVCDGSFQILAHTAFQQFLDLASDLDVRKAIIHDAAEVLVRACLVAALELFAVSAIEILSQQDNKVLGPLNLCLVRIVCTHLQRRLDSQ